MSELKLDNKDIRPPVKVTGSATLKGVSRLRAAGESKADDKSNKEKTP